DIAPKRAITIQHHHLAPDELERGTRAISQMVAIKTAQIDRLRRDHELDGDDATQIVEHWRYPGDGIRGHWCMIFHAFGYGQAVEARRIRCMAYAIAERGQRLLHGGKTRMRGAMFRELQRQTAELRRKHFDAALDGDGCAMREGDRKCIERNGQVERMKIAVRQQ